MKRFLWNFTPLLVIALFLFTMDKSSEFRAAFLGFALGISTMNVLTAIDHDELRKRVSLLEGK